MILGIDPGTANTGWAVLSRSKIKDQRLKTNTSDFILIDYGVLKTKIGDGEAGRLLKIYKEMERLIKKYRVKIVAVEGLFFAKNARSAIRVAEAIGVIKVCGRMCGTEVFSYTPLQVKMAMVGYGRAEKEQVELMVRQELGLKEAIKIGHASDAAAVALTHIFSLMPGGL